MKPVTQRSARRARLVADHASAVLPLDDKHLGEEYSYSSLPLCVIDSVFSIGVNYASTRATVARACKALKIERLSDDFPPPPGAQLTVSAFLKKVGSVTPDDAARDIYVNRQRTSTRPGSILKAEAVVRVCRVLKAHGVETMQDLLLQADNETLREEIKSLPGQSSGICWRYMLMLAGHEGEVKPDRMVIRFVCEATGEVLGFEDARTAVLGGHAILSTDWPDLTVRRFDHLIWRYQRERDVPTRMAAAEKVVPPAPRPSRAR